MKQYSNIKRQYKLTFKGIDAVTAQYSKSFKNTTQYKNLRRFRFNLNGNFNHIQLGHNARVTIESIFIPNELSVVTNDKVIIVRLRDIDGIVYDTEMGVNNNPIILYTMIQNQLYENQTIGESKTFPIPRDFLNKGYIEFDLYLESLVFTSDVDFEDENFMVSLVVFEEDVEVTKDLINAPQVVNNPPQKPFNNFYPNYNNS